MKFIILSFNEVTGQLFSTIKHPKLGLREWQCSFIINMNIAILDNRLTFERITYNLEDESCNNIKCKEILNCCPDFILDYTQSNTNVLEHF